MRSSSDSIFPSPDTLNEMEYGRFVLANLAAKRAKQIKDGAPPLVRIDSNHPLSIAYAEIAAGKIKPILGADAQQAVEFDEDYTAALDSLGLDDVGLLLPAVEEDMEDLGLGALGDLGLLDDEDDEPAVALDAEDDVEAATLGDLLGDEADEVAAESDEMSLDDLAEQENAEEDLEEDV